MNKYKSIMMWNVFQLDMSKKISVKMSAVRRKQRRIGRFSKQKGRKTVDSHGVLNTFFVWIFTKVNCNQFSNEINFNMEKGMHCGHKYSAGGSAEYLDLIYVFKSTVPDEIHP